MKRWDDYGPYQVGEAPDLDVDIISILNAHPKAYFRVLAD